MSECVCACVCVCARVLACALGGVTEARCDIRRCTLSHLLRVGEGCAAAHSALDALSSCVKKRKSSPRGVVGPARKPDIF